MFRWPLRKKNDKTAQTEKNPLIAQTEQAGRSQQTQDLNTDAAWEEWGRRDPYFGVITNPKFRRTEITEQTKHEFFESGRMHVDYVMHTIRHYVDPTFVPKGVLDFGCGVGRTLLPFARIVEHAVGLDVSPGMLQEARRNCEQQQLNNVSLMPSDDSLSSLTQSFDLIHSFIVFQHIPTERGMQIFRNLLTHLRAGGIGAIHFCYSKSRYVSPPETPVTAAGVSVTVQAVGPPPVTLREGDPEMQMNLFNMNELFSLLQEFHVQRVHAEFTDHGGELGVFLYFLIGTPGSGLGI
jgi:SAM-dependent methyltransferase